MRRRKTGGEGEETCLVAASRTSPASHDDGVIATLDNKERRPYEHTREGSCRRRRTSNGCCGCKKKLLVSARRRVAMVDRGPRAATAMAMARLPPSFSLPLPSLSRSFLPLPRSSMCTIFGPQFTTEQEDEILRFFKPLPKRQSIAGSRASWRHPFRRILVRTVHNSRRRCFSDVSGS